MVFARSSSNFDLLGKRKEQFLFKVSVATTGTIEIFEFLDVCPTFATGNKKIFITGIVSITYAKSCLIGGGGGGGIETFDFHTWLLNFCVCLRFCCTFSLQLPLATMTVKLFAKKSPC